MPYYDSKLEFEVYFPGDTEGKRYPALIVQGEISLKEVPANATDVVVWKLGEADTIGNRDRTVISVYSKTSAGRWAQVY